MAIPDVYNLVGQTALKSTDLPITGLLFLR
jgi:hypothetical protein